jgi:glucokinase
MNTSFIESAADDSFPRLLADIGGTHARFVVETRSGNFEGASVLACAEHASISSAISVYLSRVRELMFDCRTLRHAAIAIATAIDGDLVRMTNHHWSFSIAALRGHFQFETLEVVNDFKALAMSIPRLGPSDTVKVGDGEPNPRGVIGLMGAGTGLGVSALIPMRDRYVALDSEGGHVTFSPSTDTEMAILSFARREYPHVSAERLLSGIGLRTVYRALAEQMSRPAEPIDVPEIITRGLRHACPVCDATIDVFCDMLGTVAGNIGVTFGAKGGIYIGGGIVPRLGERFVQSGFRARFQDKGRFSDYLARMPTYVIAAENPAFLGVSSILDDVLRERETVC